jgi:hypothetical protein
MTVLVRLTQRHIPGDGILQNGNYFYHPLQHQILCSLSSEYLKVLQIIFRFKTVK